MGMTFHEAWYNAEPGDILEYRMNNGSGVGIVAAKRFLDSYGVAVNYVNEKDLVTRRWTIQKRKKEKRSVSGEVKWMPGGHCVGGIYPAGGLDGAKWSDLVGKSGKMTFEWEE